MEDSAGFVKKAQWDSEMLREERQKVRSEGEGAGEMPPELNKAGYWLFSPRDFEKKKKKKKFMDRNRNINLEFFFPQPLKDNFLADEFSSIRGIRDKVYCEQILI